MSATAIKLVPRYIEKPWGRTALPAMFSAGEGRRIGEIWFEHPAGEDLPLLVKYLFSSDKLSVQVHPDDAQARANGFPRGKAECWYVLDADDDARIAHGLTRELSDEQLRSAALDGSIEGLLDWMPARGGDFFYIPAGTVHAVRGGIALLELGQNADATYRLYDYGRARALHLDHAVSVASARPSQAPVSHALSRDDDCTLLSASPFCLVRARCAKAVPAALANRLRWAIPLAGQVSSGGETVAAGECLLVPPGAPLAFGNGAVALIGAEGPL